MYTYSRSMPIQFSIVHILIWVNLHLHRQMEIDKYIHKHNMHIRRHLYVNATCIELLVLFHLMPAVARYFNTDSTRTDGSGVVFELDTFRAILCVFGQGLRWGAEGPVVQDGLELQKVPGWYSNSKIFWNSRGVVCYIIVLFNINLPQKNQPRNGTFGIIPRSFFSEMIPRIGSDPYLKFWKGTVTELKINSFNLRKSSEPNHWLFRFDSFILADVRV